MAQAQVQTQLTSQRSERDWPFKVKPLHPVLGCEITGITLAEAVSPALFAKVYEAFLTYELILFRDVDLPPATQVAFARNFGEVQVHVLSQYHGYKEHPEIYMLSNLDKDFETERTATASPPAWLSLSRLGTATRFETTTSRANIDPPSFATAASRSRSIQPWSRSGGSFPTVSRFAGRYPLIVDHNDYGTPTHRQTTRGPPRDVPATTRRQQARTGR